MTTAHKIYENGMISMLAYWRSDYHTPAGPPPAREVWYLCAWMRKRERKEFSLFFLFYLKEGVLLLCLCFCVSMPAPGRRFYTNPRMRLL